MNPIFDEASTHDVTNPLARRLRKAFALKQITRADVEAKLKTRGERLFGEVHYAYIKPKLLSPDHMTLNFFSLTLKMMFDMTAEQIDAVLREDYVAAGIRSEDA